MSVASTTGARVQLSVAEASQFLFHEARLLDEERYDEWLDLFADDGEYWVPATPGQPDALNHVSLVHENALMRRVRVERFSKSNAFSLQPKPRSVRIVSNIMVDGCDAGAEVHLVTSRFLVTQYRRDRSTHFVGAYTHRLAQTSEGLKIKLKKAELIDCDGMHGDILVYL